MNLGVPGVGFSDNSAPGLLPLITVLAPFVLDQMALMFLFSLDESSRVSRKVTPLLKSY